MTFNTAYIYTMLFIITILLINFGAIQSNKIHTDVEVPELSYLTNVFNSCHIHFINYRRINFDQSKFVTPISICFFTFEKFLRNPEVSQNETYFSLKYEGIHNKTDTTNVRANFRWSCNFHVFLLPEASEIESHEQIPNNLVNRWNGEQSMQRASFKEANHKVFRFDYFFLITTSTSRETYGDWANNLEFASFIENNGYFHRAVVVVKSHNQEEIPDASHVKTFQVTSLLLEISEIFVICPFCIPETYEYIHIDKLQYFSEYKEIFDKALSVHHPANPIGLTDLKFVGEFHKPQTFVDPDFRKVSLTDKIDMIYLSIVYSNRTYTRLFVPELRKARSPCLPWISIRVAGSTVMSILQNSYTFITCDGLRGFPRPPFLIFISAFEVFTWILLICCGIVLALALKVVSKLQKVEVKASLIPLQAILEQDVSMESRKMAGFSWLVGTWMIVCVILTNAYKGQTITELTAPPKPLLYETFDQLLESDFNFNSNRARIYIIASKRFINYPDPKNTDLLRALWSYQIVINPSTSLTSHDPNHTWNSPRFSKIKSTMNKVLDRTHSVIHNETYDVLLESILDCNKSAAVEEVETIDKYEIILRRMKPQTYIARGKENILTTPSGWKISTVKDPLLNWRLECLLQSGINLVWQSYVKFMGEIEKDAVEDSFKAEYEVSGTTSYIGATTEEAKPLSIGGNLRVVFYMYVIAVTWSIIVYFVECLSYIYRKLCYKINKRKAKQISPYIIHPKKV